MTDDGGDDTHDIRSEREEVSDGEETQCTRTHGSDDNSSTAQGRYIASARRRYLPAVTMLRRTRAWSCDPTGPSECYVEATSNDVRRRSGVRRWRAARTEFCVIKTGTRPPRHTGVPAATDASSPLPQPKTTPSSSSSSQTRSPRHRRTAVTL